MKIRLSIILIIGALFFSSCASIFGGRKNTINVKTGNPEQVDIYLDGQFIGQTPFRKRVAKRMIQEGSVIELKKEGYETLSYEVVRSPHVGYIALDVIFSGSLALILDVATGNIYRPNTRHIEYELVPLGEPEKSNDTNQ